MNFIMHVDKCYFIICLSVLFQDIKWLLNNLPNIKSTLYIDKIPFSHQSFAMDKIAHIVIGPYILKQLSS